MAFTAAFAPNESTSTKNPLSFPKAKSNPIPAVTDTFGADLFHSRGGLFRAYFHSPESDALLEEIQVANEPGRRDALVRRFEELLARRDGLAIRLLRSVAQAKVSGTVAARTRSARATICLASFIQYP